jgi:Flp pilus assembly protein TadG
MKALAASRWRRMRWLAGATMVEFGLVAVAFFLLIFGIIQMALAVFAYNTVCSADREAVRYAMVHGPSSANPATNSQIQQVAINAAPSLQLSTSNITVSWPSDANLPSIKDAQVKISYNYRFQIPFMSPVTLKLTATSQMLVSQ